jgi:glucan phosphoethanolaminetransferase (alkaline phosphatase superfamily)
MLKTSRVNLLFALLQSVLVLGLIIVTNTEVPARATLLLQQGRVSTLATTGVIWLIALSCIAIVMLEKRTWVRLFWGAVIALSGTVAWGFQRAAHLELSVFDILGFWEARHEAGNASAIYGDAIKLAVILAVASVIVFSLPFISRQLGIRRFGFLRAVLPILPIAIVAGVVFQKGGNGHFAMPKQFSQISLAALATAKLAVQPTVERNDVAMKVGPSKAATHILYLVDESLRPDYISTVPGNNVTPNFASFASQMVNYGPASSGAICSNYANAVLRFMPSRADIGGGISSTPTIWQYAKAAGFRTVYIDAQGHAIENETRLQNFMTPIERKQIDEFYPLVGATSNEADRALLDIINKEFAKPGPVFIYANKQGMHFPYDQNYYTDFGPHHPEQSEVGTIEINSMLNSYRNAVDWNVDKFFAEFAKRISMKDLAMVYTSDHGQYFAPHEATHCKSSDSHPQMAYVPMFAYVDSAAGMSELAQGAAQSKGRANHFQIAPTMLHWMGFAEADIAAHYPESLHTGTKLEPAYTLGDIFGLFSSDVEWVKIDLEKNYLEPETAKAVESLTAVVKQ